MSSTATVTPVAKFTTDRFERAYGYKITKNADGSIKKEPVVISVEDAEELEKEEGFEGQVVTLSVDYPATWEGLLDYATKSYTDDEGNPRDTSEVLAEVVKLFRAGASIKVNNRMRAILGKVDEAGNFTFSDDQLTDGVLDLTEEITSGSKRVFLTEEQKTWKNLSNLPADLRKNMFDVYLTSIGKEPGQYPAD